MNNENEIDEPKINEPFIHRFLTKLAHEVRVDIGLPIAFARTHFVPYNEGYVFKDHIGHEYTDTIFSQGELERILPYEVSRDTIRSDMDYLVIIYIQCNTEGHTPDRKVIGESLRKLKELSDQI